MSYFNYYKKILISNKILLSFIKKMACNFLIQKIVFEILGILIIYRQSETLEK